MKINRPRNNPRKIIYTILGIVFLFLVAYGVASYLMDIWPFKSLDKTQSQQTTNTVNYNPPTSQEIEDSQNGKRDITGADPNNSQSAATSKNISVGVSFADVMNGNLEIRAFTPSVVAGDGICTATLNKGTLVVSRSSQAFIDSSTSQCQAIYIPVSEFSEKGTWSLIVSYKSPSSSGNSETIEVNI